MNIPKKIVDYINKAVSEAAKEAADTVKIRLEEDQKNEMLAALVGSFHGEFVGKISETASRIGIETYKKEREESVRQKYGRRLRNTKVLLREYRNLKKYSENAICKKSDSNEAMAVLEEIDNTEMEDELYVDAIKKSKDRTQIIIDHIHRMLDIYKTLCEKNNDKKGGEYSVDRWNAIYFRYICDEEKSIDDIAAENSCGKSKVYNDIDDAARTLTTLMFGIDGLKLRR